MAEIVLKGRKQIFTPFSVDHEFNKEDLAKVVNKAIETHLENAREIDYLISYFKGNQPILGRVKTVREDVNNKLVFNYAQSATRDIVGYTFGKPLQYTQRKSDGRDEILILNDYMEMVDKPALDQELATYNSICGVSYRGIFPKKVEDKENEVPFELVTLLPQNTFVIYSHDIGNKPVIAVTYVHNKIDDKTIYYIYTLKKQYKYIADGVTPLIVPTDLTDEKPNILGDLPIIEYMNNQWRMGHWETAVTVLDAINLVGSDSVNDIIQFVNSIMVAINAEIDEEVMTQINTYKIASIRSPQGLNADLKYISTQVDSTGVQVLRQYLEDAYRVIVGIPDRKSRSGGGDTGDAVKLRDGWQDIEIVARTTEMFFKRSEKQVLSVLIKILGIEETLKELKLKNIDIKFTRNKTDNLQSKVQSGQILNAMALYDPVDITDLMDITTDPQEMVDRGKIYQDQKMKEQDEHQIKMMEQTQKLSADNEQKAQMKQEKISGGRFATPQEARKTNTKEDKK